MNGFNEVVTELQKKLKPLIVYDYLTKNGYEEVPTKFAKAMSVQKRTSPRRIEMCASAP